LQTLLPRREIFTWEGHKVGLYHGRGAPQNIFETLEAEFKKEKLDAIIFGHTHRPFNEKKKGILYFNPGSATDTIFAPYRSYGILDVTPESIVGTIIKLEPGHG